MILDNDGILALHREITAAPSVSGNERHLADFLEGTLFDHDVAVQRIGNSLVATVGSGPVLLLDTHIDTVPPVPGWTRPPHRVESVDGRVYGLGSSDAKASVAAMTGAFLAFEHSSPPVTLILALVEGEELSGTGTEQVLAALEARGRRPAAAVLGEPTGLDIAVAQKGLLILKLVTEGDVCHTANAHTLGARNAVRDLARGLVALESADLGPDHRLLGSVTWEPTLVEGGVAKNMVPGEAWVMLDVRTTPVLSHDAVVKRFEAAMAHGVLEVVSKRLEPRETARDETVVEAAVRARPGAKTYGSATLSDMVFMRGIPAVKCGPGRAELSHTPDEFVLESDILDGVRFYTDLIRNYIRLVKEGSDA